MKAKGMKSGGAADKTGRAMTKQRQTPKAVQCQKPKMMAVGGMMKKAMLLAVRLLQEKLPVVTVLLERAANCRISSATSRTSSAG